jgi:hypothetical protein
VAQEQATAQSLPLRASLQFDSSQLGAHGKPLVMQLQSRADALMRELEFLPARGAQDLLILVKLARLEDGPGTSMAFSGLRGGQAYENPIGLSQCPLCTDGEVTEMFAEQLRAYLEHVSESERTNTGAAQASEPVATQSLAPTVQVEVRDRPGAENKAAAAPAKPGLSRMQWLGVGVGGGGLVLAGVGTGFVFAGENHDGTLEPLLKGEGKSLRPAGIALIGTGVVALTVGVVLFVRARNRAK